MRGCRKVALISYCVLHSMLVKINEYILKRREEILAQFVREVARRKIGTLLKQWKMKNPKSLRNKIRDSMSCAVGLKMLSQRFIVNAKRNLGGFLYAASKKFYLELKFRKLFKKIIKT